MAIGNPLLATWANDNLIRTYELIGGVFTPLGVSGAIVHSPLSTQAVNSGNIYPGMTWTNEDDYLLVEHAPNGINGAHSIKSLTSSAAQIGVLASDAGTNVAGGIWKPLRDINAAVFRSSGLSQGVEFTRIQPDGSPQRTNFANNPVTNPTSYDMDVSRDGTRVMLCTTEGLKVSDRTSALGDWPPTFNAAQIISTSGITPEKVAILGNNDTILLASVEDGLLQTWNFDGLNWTKSQDLTLPTGTIRRMVSSPDGYGVAVSVLNGAVYTTRIFARVGIYMTQLQDIAAFGNDLTISIDGNLIVDAPLKKAYVRDQVTGQFSELVGAGANLADGILSASLSLAPYYPAGLAQIYSEGLAEIAEGGLDLDNLKLTLLSDAASFNDADISVSDVTNAGAFEITGGAWPTGGVTLANVAAALVAPQYEFTSFDTEWTTFGSAMTFRYGLIYDATSSVPLIFYDFLAERTILANRKVTFSFPADIFVRLTK